MKKFVSILFAGMMMLAACSKDENDGTTSGGGTQDPPVNPTPTPAMEGELPGEFTVSPNKKVHFSQGNLQYTTAGTHATADGIKPGTWRFAERQYDAIGEANKNASSTYTGWIDLFGWGTSGYHNPNDQNNVNYNPYSTSESRVNATYNYFGYGPSTDQADSNLTGSSANYDWGAYNAISNGGNAVGQWRTLSINEWNTVLRERPNASSLNGQATVCGVSGLVLLPDAWILPAGVTFTSGYGNGYTTNTYTEEQWRKMEGGGAVFLPAAGYRLGTGVSIVGSGGCYWSSTAYGTCAYNLDFYSVYAYASNYYYRYTGRSVRLVR